MLFELGEALYDEKKRGGQPAYKQKVLSKVCQMLTIVLYKSSDPTKI